MSIKRLNKHAKDKPMVETITEPTHDDLYELFADVYEGTKEVIEDVIESITPALNQLLNIHTVLLFRDLEQWFIDKGLDKADPKKQFEKLLEEVEETKEALQSGDIEHIQEELADIVIVVQGLFLQHDLDFIASLQKGYNKISKREGKIIDGKFVKKGDY